MRVVRGPSTIRALTASVVLTLSFAAPSSAASATLAVHGVTAVATDVDTCDTRVEVGFRAEISDLALSNGQIDLSSVTAKSMTVDGDPARSYGTRTDFGAAPYYFATLELGSIAAGVHELFVAGGQGGVAWRAFDHANPDHTVVIYLDGDYRLGFTVPPCEAAEPVMLSEFAPPVDAAPIQNLIRRGLTAPIRFQAFRDQTILTDPAEFTVTTSRARCPATPIDRVETVVRPVRTGDLFYDPHAQRFVYRWTATGTHPCWDVTFEHSDGPTLTARFRIYGSP